MVQRATVVLKRKTRTARGGGSRGTAGPLTGLQSARHIAALHGRCCTALHGTALHGTAQHPWGSRACVNDAAVVTAVEQARSTQQIAVHSDSTDRSVKWRLVLAAIWEC
eukprot:COSAG02_NODE_4300_length_5532_cov_6.802503_3_plen_109_part_00